VGSGSHLISVGRCGSKATTGAPLTQTKKIAISSGHYITGIHGRYNSLPEYWNMVVAIGFYTRPKYVPPPTIAPTPKPAGPAPTPPPEITPPPTPSTVTPAPPSDTPAPPSESNIITAFQTLSATQKYAIGSVLLLVCCCLIFLIMKKK